MPDASPVFVQVAASTPQTNQTTVATAFGQTQTAGNLNVVVVGWNNATSNITSLTDSHGNTYQLAAPTTRSGGAISQAVYYAKNITAGANTVSVTFNTSTPYVDVRVADRPGFSAGPARRRRQRSSPNGMDRAPRSLGRR